MPENDDDTPAEAQGELVTPDGELRWPLPPMESALGRIRSSQSDPGTVYLARTMVYLAATIQTATQALLTQR